MPLVSTGIDCSTQSLTAIVIEIDGDTRRVVFNQSLNFDRRLSRIRHDRRRGAAAPTARCSASPLMWADALDRMMAGSRQRPPARRLDRSARHLRLGATARQRLPERHAPRRLAQRSIHRSRWRRSCRRSFRERLAGVDGREHDRRSAARSKRRSAAPTRAPRSPARRRASDSPVRRSASSSRRSPRPTRATARIHLVSSYLASLLIGGDAPIDPGDGSGMNLMDLRRRPLVGGGARRHRAGSRLAPAGDRAVVRRSSGHCRRTGRIATASRAATIVPWTGDNPSSLIGTGIMRDDGARRLARHERHGVRAAPPNRDSGVVARVSARRPATS